MKTAMRKYTYLLVEENYFFTNMGDLRKFINKNKNMDYAGFHIVRKNNNSGNRDFGNIVRVSENGQFKKYEFVWNGELFEKW